MHESYSTVFQLILLEAPDKVLFQQTNEKKQEPRHKSPLNCHLYTLR